MRLVKFIFRSKRIGRIVASLDGASFVRNCVFKNFLMNYTYFLFNFFNSDCFAISETDNKVFSAVFEDLIFSNSLFLQNSGIVNSASNSQQFLFKNLNIDNVTSGKNLFF